MTHEVSSWFIAQTLLKSPANTVRQFLIGTSDYSDHINKWPTFKNAWNSIKPVNLTIQLANEDGNLNFLRNDKTILNIEASVKFGFTHPTSGNELITLFTGATDTIRYNQEAVDITIVDKFKQLTERVIGSSDEPVLFTSSDYLPADIVWSLITSYGGFDTTANSSNTDIDYESWLAWSDVFSVDAVFMNAEFKGTKVNEAIRKFGRATQSAIFIHDNKITFNRFTLADANVSSFNDSNIKNVELEFSGNDIINKQYIFANYDINSEYHQITVSDINTTSVNSYGLREETDKDESIWYVGSGPALNAAQRYISVYKEPFDKISLRAPMVGVNRLIGETISVVDDFFGIDSSFRIMEENINIDTMEVILSADQSQVSNAFILDTSTLGGIDILL